MPTIEERVIELPKEVYVGLSASLEPTERFVEVEGGEYRRGDQLRMRGLVLYVLQLDGTLKKLIFTRQKT